ncbi:MAG: methylated-DNA--[protein]-cysteine S-methyltransferase [Sciscionella sp.]|nr:methylated-DNA--[protein]-cysteine S-methyltransferase [Sciscionella sp.]
MAIGYSVFDTAIGACSIVWRENAILDTELPQRDTQAAHARIHRHFPAAKATPPPTEIDRTIDKIVRLLNGEHVDLSDAVLDMRGVGEFQRKVYEIVRTIAPGRTMTYGEVAGRLGDRLAAQAVGRAMARNPFPIIVPCHRVLAANGKPGGFSAVGGIRTKLTMLTIEGWQPDGEPTLFQTDGIHVL